jgi:hypothetical protein
VTGAPSRRTLGTTRLSGTTDLNGPCLELGDDVEKNGPGVDLRLDGQHLFVDEHAATQQQRSDVVGKLEIDHPHRLTLLTVHCQVLACGS